MQTDVVAKRDIRSSRGLLIAKRGEHGSAVDVVPHEKVNFGKVAVYWGHRTRWYWVSPGEVDWVDKELKPIFIAQRRPGPRPISSKCIRAFPKYELDCSFHFGCNLRKLREIRGISQSQLASRMGLRQSAISYRERKPKAASDEFVRRSSKILQVPPFLFLFPLEDLGAYMTARLFLSGASSAFCEEEKCPTS